MSEKMDFSKLADADESLISWEDLFPEYAIGGKSFKSGQQNVPPESGITPTEYFIPVSTPTKEEKIKNTSDNQLEETQLPSFVADKKTRVIQLNESGFPEITVIEDTSETAEQPKLSAKPTDDGTDDDTTPHTTSLQVSADLTEAYTPDIQLTETTTQQSFGQSATGVEVLSLSDLPEIPSLTDDDTAPQSKAKPSVLDLMNKRHKNKSESQIHTDNTFQSDYMKDINRLAKGRLSLESLTDLANENSLGDHQPDWIERALTESNELLFKEQQPEKNQDYWAARFNELNFPGMDLMAVTYFGSFTYDLLEQHMLLKRVTRDFVRLLSYNYTMELRSAGVSEEGIFYMKKGKIPENFTVHLKYPLEYGGSIEFNNMVFMQDKPFHDAIHSYLDEQMLTSKGIEYPPLLYVPTPVGKIYVPFGMFTGSGGKNKQDRSVYAGFSKAAFDKIALKAMPGR